MGYYLNTNEPAHCSGTITSVDYCYYGPSQHNRPVWGAALALYRSDGNSGYSRISDEIVLAKYAPSSPDSVLQLNQLKCETYVLSQGLRVQKGDVFGAFILKDTFASSGLDLVGDSSNGNQMMTKVASVTIIFTRIGSTPSLYIRLPGTLNGLSLDNETRVLHVHANISKSTTDYLLLDYNMHAYQVIIPPVQFHSSRL